MVSQSFFSRQSDRSERYTVFQFHGPNTIRLAHIHFDVAGKRDRLVTRMYFEGDPYNETDRLLQSANRPEALIVKLRSPSTEFEAESIVAMFDIVLRG